MKKTLITIELFLVLLVALLFGFLLFIFTNKKIEQKDPVVPVVSVDTSELYCGISITEPTIEAMVSLPITVSGYVSGCGWELYHEYVATLKIFDSEDKLIGRPYLISKNADNQSPVSAQFSFTVRDLPMQEGNVRFVFKNFGVLEKEFVLPLHLTSEMGDVSR